MFFSHVLVILATFIAGSLKPVIASEGHDGHEEVSRSNVIDEIAEHLEPISRRRNHTEFAFKNIEQLFKKLHFTQNCTQKLSYSKCNLCLTPEDFMNWYGFYSNQSSKSLTEEELRHVSVGMVYVLGEHRSEKYYSDDSSKNFSAVCKKFISSVLANKTSHLFIQYLRKYSSNKKQLNEESVEQILENINYTIGHQLTDQACFSAHDVLKGVNVSASGFGEHDLEYVSSFIILKLLNKKCISSEEHEHERKNNSFTKAYFVDTIFKEFGNGTHLSHDGFEKLYSKVLPAANNTKSSHKEEAGHDHDHRRRRSISEYLRRNRRSVESEKKCYSAESVLEVFGVHEGSVLHKEKFQEICPALVEQIESGACRKSPQVAAKPKSSSNDSWKSWVGAMVSIAVISFGSLISVVLFTGPKKKAFPYAIMFLIALGVSVLIGDALLHLIPHSLGLHGHEESGGSHDHNQFASGSYLWKCMIILAGVILFFIFEMVMHAYGSDSHGHSHSHDAIHNNGISSPGMGSPDPLKANHHDLNGEIDVVIPNDFVAVAYKNGNANGTVAIEPRKTPMPKKSFRVKDIKSIAWMIVVGDGIHNFIDGVAIGVAFSEEFPGGLHGGVSTSIAILCHELPHELGDFAVLIASGLTVKQALVLNLLSSLTAFAGGILGVSLGTKWNAAPWLFAITAGMFIYIALVDMVPQIMNSPLLKTSPKKSIALQLLGLLIGVAIMFVLAAWEEDMKEALRPK